MLCIFYCLWRDEGAYQPVSPFLVVKKPQYYHYSAHLYGKSDTDISQSIPCNWNALIKKKRCYSAWVVTARDASKGNEITWWCLAVPLQAHGHCSIASHSVPSKTQNGANSQDMKPVVDDLLALSHQMQKLRGHN